jgi:tetratricopeptide (TPR) repeat protein
MSHKAVLAVFLLLVPLGWSQRRAPVSPAGVDLSVRVLYENSRPASESLRVQLTNQMGMIQSETFTDSRGEARFVSVRPGAYRVKVSGMGIEDSTGDTFVINPRDNYSMQFVTVNRTQDRLAEEKAAAAPVSAAELNIPDKAKKEFEKGQELLEKKKMDEAVKRFAKATEIYPQYGAAFDAMGIALSGSSLADASDYFAKAIAADKQYAPAYTHLAKAKMAERDFGEAERLLTRSTSISPRSAEDLFLLAYVQAKLAKYELAIQTTDRTHQLEHNQFALVHFVAAESMSKLGRPAEAMAQYSQYLKEAPLGPSAEVAKNNIRILQAQTAQTQAPPK